eukprot:2210693-Prymnesium_polylepis.1
MDSSPPTMRVRDTGMSKQRTRPPRAAKTKNKQARLRSEERERLEVSELPGLALPSHPTDSERAHA